MPNKSTQQDIKRFPFATHLRARAKKSGIEMSVAQLDIVCEQLELNPKSLVESKVITLGLQILKDLVPTNLQSDDTSNTENSEMKSNTSEALAVNQKQLEDMVQTASQENHLELIQSDIQSIVLSLKDSIDFQDAAVVDVAELIRVKLLEYIQIKTTQQRQLLAQTFHEIETNQLEMREKLFGEFQNKASIAKVDSIKEMGSFKQTVTTLINSWF